MMDERGPATQTLETTDRRNPRDGASQRHKHTPRGIRLAFRRAGGVHRPAERCVGEHDRHTDTDEKRECMKTGRHCRGRTAMLLGDQKYKDTRQSLSKIKPNKPSLTSIQPHKLKQRSSV